MCRAVPAAQSPRCTQSLLFLGSTAIILCAAWSPLFSLCWSDLACSFLLYCLAAVAPLLDVPAQTAANASRLLAALMPLRRWAARGR